MIKFKKGIIIVVVVIIIIELFNHKILAKQFRDMDFKLLNRFWNIGLLIKLLYRLPKILVYPYLKHDNFKFRRKVLYNKTD